MLVRVIVRMSVLASLGLLLLAPRSFAVPSTGATPSKAVVGEVLPRLPLPDQDESDLLVVAVHGGEWCGTCRWLAEAEHVVTEASARTRIRRVDVILGDRDNAPADAKAIESWRRTFGVGEDRIVLSLDAVPELRPELDSATTLPLVLVVDARTQAIVARLANPDPVRLDHRIRIALAELDGRPPPPAPAEDLVRGVFHANEWALLREIATPTTPPPDPSNAVAESPEAAALGRALFHDPGLSGTGDVACASCHVAERGLSDGLPRASGVAEGERRTPTIALAAHARWQFWDGRADSLWAQALGPIESPVEMAGSRVAVARRLLGEHRRAYRRAFPDRPLPDPERWPNAGGPGDPAYDALSSADRRAITRLFVDAGKAIAAWERTLRVEATPLDRWIAGELDALSDGQVYGLQVFVRRGCMQCHWGPRLTDDAFHRTLAPTDDRGRAEGRPAWLAHEFNAWSEWSDAPSAEPRPRAIDPSVLEHQFKTPTLRGVAEAPFFMHDGRFASLSATMEAYGWGGVALGAHGREPWTGSFGEVEQWALAEFLTTLTARPETP